MQLASPKLQLLAKYGLLVHQQKQRLCTRFWCCTLKLCTRFWCVTVDGGTYVNKDCWSTGSLPVSYNCTSILVTDFKMCKCSCASPEPSPATLTHFTVNSLFLAQLSINFNLFVNIVISGTYLSLCLFAFGLFQRFGRFVH